MIKEQTNEQYHADQTATSASMLKKMDSSPRKYESRYVTKEEKDEESDALRLGTAVHTSALEPKEYQNRYIVCPAECSDKRTTKYKNWAAEYGNSGRIILKESEDDTVKRCCLSIWRNPLAAKLVIAKGLFEQSIYWTDPVTGMQCKCRPDKIAAPYVIDVKTIAECTDRDFEKAIANYGYHLQAAHYLEGVRSHFGGDVDWQFKFIVVETSSPFRCRVFDLDADSMEFASARRVALLEDMKRRQESGDWSEPGEFDLTTVSLPNWKKNQ